MAPNIEKKPSLLDERAKGLTAELSEIQPVSYHPFPHPKDKDRPYWRVHFILSTDPNQQFGIDINDEVILGRDVDNPKVYDLNFLETEEIRSVSRQHALIRPTNTHLYIIDLESTNGSMHNSRTIGINTPYALANGDSITLGALKLRIFIVQRPSPKTVPLDQNIDLAEALSQIAKAVTSQLNLDEVLNQVVTTAQLLTSAGETSLWLVDENTGELFLEAERGIDDDQISRTRIPISADNPIAQVIQTEKPLRANVKPGEAPIKVKTGYLVEALAYVPIRLGGVTLGVLSANHRSSGKRFDRWDEQLLEAIADFAAIAIQNARLYGATDQALERRIKELSALNEVSRAVSSSLNLNQVYDVLVTQFNKHWPVGAIYLYLLNEDNKCLIPFPADQTTGRQQNQIRSGILWQTAVANDVIITNSPGEHPDYDPIVDSLEGVTPTSIACVPLRVRDKVVGVLALYDRDGGDITSEDVDHLKDLANPVATAIQNARLFAESERQRAAIQATAHTLSQPLIILDESGNILVANDAANDILEKHMSALFEGISRSVGHTTEVKLDEDTYLVTSEHLSQVGTIIVMQDITYVKQLEKDRAEFMHALSHDLKTPLTSIRGFATLLQQLFPTLEGNSSKYLKRIVGASDRMLDMINQLLQIARSDAVKAEEKPCHLDDIIRRILSDVEGGALSKEITLHYHTEGDPYPLLGDQTRLYHMILNLVDNAIKYSPKNTHIYISLTYSEEEIIIQVQDEGPGIPQEDLPRVFDKYYRGAQANLHPGAGLGLSVVWGTAEAHGGRAQVKNAPNGGAVFTITLPGSLRVSD